MARSSIPQSALSVALLALAGCASLPPPSLSVASVHDGDTLTLSTGARVRIAEIDAPESCQPAGDGSTASLRALCLGRPAEVTPTARDRYGRTVARVACAGVDVSTHQVTAGWAWVYVAYAPKDSPLYPIEAAARGAQRGLWAQPAVPPWDFRRQHQPCGPKKQGN